MDFKFCFSPELANLSGGKEKAKVTCFSVVCVYVLFAKFYSGNNLKYKPEQANWSIEHLDVYRMCYYKHLRCGK